MARENTGCVAAERSARAGTLILGGGYAGSVVARKLGEATIVNPENFMLFRPLLAEAASGTIEPRHVVVPLRAMCPRAELLVGQATELDPADRVVTVESHVGTYRVRYERLVLGLGSIARVLPIPGLAEHGRGLNDLADAIALRNQVLRELEAADGELDPAALARHLTFVFVGAGYAGVEGLAELNDLVRSALRYYPRLREVRQRWVLVEATSRILPEIPTALGDWVAELLTKRGVEIRTETRLDAVDADSALLSDGQHIPTHTLVWTAGVRPNPLLAEWGFPVDDRGRVLVDELLRVQGVDGVWALGDCARVPNPAAETPDPPTSQHALRQARALARTLQGRPRPYRYRMIGQGATLGRYKGIADIFGLRFHGFLGWFLTRTYHLHQLPLLGRKVRVATDWTVALLFRRDIAELGTLGHPKPLR
jgi:NADH:quinone reductase (non-electrogenic)